MTTKRSRRHWLALTLGLVCCGCGAQTDSADYRPIRDVPAPSDAGTAGTAPHIETRLIFQDYESKTLKWVDIVAGTPPTLRPVATVAGFPKLDASRQQLVQMELASGMVLVGVRESGDERKENGWVLINAGAAQEEHGDHSHWHYEQPPRVRAKRLDAKQGNPAHLYLYDNVFFLANDENSGYTRLDPGAITHEALEPDILRLAGFHRGGGHHITLAVAGGRVGYGAWIDGGGPNKGRVDVTRIRPEGNDTIAYQFALPSGGIHGATVCEDKVFFAPSDGLCWVKVDSDAAQKGADVEVHHLSLGKNEESGKPCRTGAFATHCRHVLFVSGEGPDAFLGLVDAGAESPAVVKLSLGMKSGNRPVTPEVIKTRGGRRLAFVFHDHPQDVEAENRLTVIDLDPNGDGQFADAVIARNLDVGPSRLDGHYGHHSMAFDADARHAYFTNPGDGTLVMLDLKTLEPVATFRVGGVPTKLLAHGGREETD